MKEEKIIFNSEGFQGDIHDKAEHENASSISGEVFAETGAVIVYLFTTLLVLIIGAILYYFL